MAAKLPFGKPPPRAPSLYSSIRRQGNFEQRIQGLVLSIFVAEWNSAIKEEVIQRGIEIRSSRPANGKSWLVSSFELDSSIRNSFEFGHSLALQLEMLVN